MQLNVIRLHNWYLQRPSTTPLYSNCSAAPRCALNTTARQLKNTIALNTTLCMNPPPPSPSKRLMLFTNISSNKLKWNTVKPSIAYMHPTNRCLHSCYVQHIITTRAVILSTTPPSLRVLQLYNTHRNQISYTTLLLRYLEWLSLRYYNVQTKNGNLYSILQETTKNSHYNAILYAPCDADVAVKSFLVSWPKQILSASDHVHKHMSTVRPCCWPFYGTTSWMKKKRIKHAI